MARIVDVQIPFHIYMALKTKVDRVEPTDFAAFLMDAHDMDPSVMVRYMLGSTQLPDVYGYLYCYYYMLSGLLDSMDAINNETD